MGSVANTPEIDAAAGTATTRPNPVALETLVTVTGARPSSEGARDLFTEETRTILVFVDGAVIQLSSPVSEGQLLFLTNKKSNEEVVCQVLHKRKSTATACYVELQFTEDKPNYWGVAFPKGKKRAAEFAAPEQVAAERTTEQDVSPAPARSEKDVEELKTQVEALRKQLAELEKMNAAETAAKAVAERAAAEEHAAAEAAIREAEELKANAAKTNQDGGPAYPIPPQTSAAPAEAESLLMPPAISEKKPAPGWTVRMALPTQPHAPAGTDAKEIEAAALPKPELDFSSVPHEASADEIAARASLKHVSRWREKLILAGLVVVLLAVGYGAYDKLSPYVASLRKKPVSVNAAVKPSAPKATAAPKAASVAPIAAVGNSATPEKPTAPEMNSVVAKGDSANVTPPPIAPPADANESAAAAAVSSGDSAKRAIAPKERPARKQPTDETVKAAVPADAVPADAPLIEAKLLHAATPVYPPDAMRSYITGDVKAELVIEPSGKVVDVKVLSGPAALRDAAIEALKKYQYAPATQGGKAVSSKTTAVVKFWFNP